MNSETKERLTNVVFFVTMGLFLGLVIGIPL